MKNLARLISVFFAAVLMSFGSGSVGFAQEVKPPETAGPAPALRVFLDGDMTGSDYIKTEIKFVEYVRDRKDADLHVLSTSIYSSARIGVPGSNSSVSALIRISISRSKCFSDRLATEDEHRDLLRSGFKDKG